MGDWGWGWTAVDYQNISRFCKSTLKVLCEYKRIKRVSVLQNYSKILHMTYDDITTTLLYR